MEQQGKFEKLVGLAVKAHCNNSPTICEISECLSNDTLYALHENRLPENKRHEAIAHLARCRGCRTDLQIYSELMSQNNQKSN
jgi:hypothetical protein